MASALEMKASVVQDPSPSLQPEPQYRNIVVLGLSQHGKTSFINQCLELQGRTSAEPVGSGTVSLTKAPRVLALHPVGQSTQVVGIRALPGHGAESEQEQRAMWRARSDLTNEEYTADVTHAAPLFAALHESQPQLPAPQLCIRALDTPGLEDTRGEDDEHVMKIVEAVLKMGSLSALVLVCGRAPIDSTWKSHFLRYWELFPMMQRRWIVVHTHSDPFARGAMHRRNKSSYETECRERKLLVTQAIKEVSGDENAESAHLFVECDWDGSEVLKAMFAESMNELTSCISQFQPVQIEELNFPKGRAMLEVDGALLSALQAEIDAIEGGFQRAENFLQNQMRLVDQCSQDADRANQQLDRVESELREMDSPDLVLVESQQVLCAPKDCGYSRAVAAFVFPHSCQIKTSLEYMTGWCRAHPTIEFQRRESLADGRTRVEVGVVVRRPFTTTSCKVLFHCKKQEHYAEQIRGITSSRERLSILWNSRQTSLKTHESILQNQRAELDAQKDRCEKLKEMKALLEMSWTLGMYRDFHKIYRTERIELMTVFEKAFDSIGRR